MKVQLLTATILLLGVVASSAGSNQNPGNAPGRSSPTAGSSGRMDNPGYLTGPRNVRNSDTTLRSSAGMQPIWNGTNNERARVCDPSKQLRVGDGCVALGPD